MVIDIDNGFILNTDTIRSILLKVYENKPNFPIIDKDILEEALGGKNQLFKLNDTDGEISASTIAEKTFDYTDNIEEPNQIIDSLLGESFINIITKTMLMNTISNIKYPIDSKAKFSQKTKDLIIFGLPMEIIADKLDYPVNKPEQILNRIKLVDRKLLDANTKLIANIEDSQASPPELSQISAEPGEIVSDIKQIEAAETGMASKPSIGDEIDQQLSSTIESIDLSLKEKIRKIIEYGKDAYRQQQYKKSIEIYEMGLNLDSENTELSFLKKTVIAKINDMVKGPAIGSGPDVVPGSEITGEEQEVQAPGSGVEEVGALSEATPNTESSPAEASGTSQDETAAEPIKTPKPPEDFEIDEANYDIDDDKIEKLEKKLQEKVKVLQNLSSRSIDLAQDACNSCEGRGECYWCKGSTKCSKCSGSAKNEVGEDCPECKGSGNCHSCNGSGKCHWCHGTGKRKS